jgi:hypothetical protein
MDVVAGPSLPVWHPHQEPLGQQLLAKGKVDAWAFATVALGARDEDIIPKVPSTVGDGGLILQVGGRRRQGPGCVVGIAGLRRGEAAHTDVVSHCQRKLAHGLAAVPAGPDPSLCSHSAGIMLTVAAGCSSQGQRPLVGHL